MDCLDEGLPLVVEGTLWYEWLHAIDHSLNLNQQDSFMYIQFTAIPKFHEYGTHTLAMECYKWLSDHCKKKGMHKQAGKYTEKVMEIYQKLVKGDISL